MYKVLIGVTMCLFAVTYFAIPHGMALNADNLVAVWLMDDAAGNTVKDSSGNGLDGEVASGNPEWSDGKFGGALQFGGNDMVIVEDDPALDLETFTLAAWVNIPGIPGPWQIIASKENRNPTGRNYGLFANNNTGVIHYSFTTAATWNSFNAQTAVTDGDWHHIAATYDGTDFKLYLNGEIDGQVAPATKPDNHDNFLFIGGCDIGNYWMTGSIDEIVLYGRDLSPQEINELIEDGILTTLDVQPGGKLGTTWARLKAQ